MVGRPVAPSLGCAHRLVPVDDDEEEVGYYL